MSLWFHPRLNSLLRLLDEEDNLLYDRPQSRSTTQPTDPNQPSAANRSTNKNDSSTAVATQNQQGDAAATDSSSYDPFSLSSFWGGWPNVGFRDLPLSTTFGLGSGSQGGRGSSPSSALAQAFMTHNNRPAIDVHEEADKYVLEADVPGANKEDLKLEFTDSSSGRGSSQRGGGQVLTLSGKVSKSWSQAPPSESTTTTATTTEATTNGVGKGTSVEKKGKGEVQGQGQGQGQEDGRTIWSSERFEGSFVRSLRFPKEIDVSKVTAKYDQGVLKVVIPKLKKEEREEEVKKSIAIA